MSPPSLSVPDPTVRPTRVRHGVVALAIGLAMVTYLDRACIGTLAPYIMADLSLSKGQMSTVFSAFAFAYALFEIPTAWWADRQGTRRVLTRIVLWWSAFTMATAAAAGVASMVIIRFLFGLGEAGAWPCVARTFSHWVPLSQRGRVQGIFFSGAHLAGGLTPMVALALNSHFGWRAVFIIFGTLGLVWAFVWHRWFRDEPAQHPSANAAEVALIAEGRIRAPSSHEGWTYWRRLFAHRNTLPLCLSYIPNSCAFYFCITWLPTYLKEKHQFENLSLGFFSGLPLIFAVTGDLFGGAATDWATRRFGLRLGRAGVSGLGNLLAGLAMIAATFVHNPYAAIGLISLSVAATMFTLGATWGTCLDIGGAHVGVVSAAMNTSGQIGTIFGPPLVTWLLASTGDWNTAILVIGGLFLAGATCWLVIDPRDRVFE
ncbi:MAG: MFS transporter [Verrucomicrobia bacterium]|nr:MFS transporter [Verrucomicrobiota bacterium]